MLKHLQDLNIRLNKLKDARQVYDDFLEVYKKLSSPYALLTGKEIKRIRSLVKTFIKQEVTIEKTIKETQDKCCHRFESKNRYNGPDEYYECKFCGFGRYV